LVQRKRGGAQVSQDGYGERASGERGKYREHEREPHDDPDEHHRIENYRFLGSLPATPERYELAREQWRRLPGGVVGPSMNPAFSNPALSDPALGAPTTAAPSPPEEGHSSAGGADQ